MNRKNPQFEKLTKTSLLVRESCLGMAYNGGCFLGASLSCVDILVYLYGHFLNCNKNNFRNENRDYLFLSKGHDVPALYSVLAENGFFSKDRLLNHLSGKDFIYWHPNTKIPGIEFHSGSLGHLPSVSLGVAINNKLKKINSKVITIIGDGELNEGSIWECLLVASSLKIANYCLIVDRNHFQANGPTEEIMPLEPLREKFISFGCNVYTVNGHSFEEMNQCFESINFNSPGTKVIICDTIRGKGIPSIEAKADKWFCTLDKEMYDNLLIELQTGDESGVQIPSTCVR